jgi:hypothetical protein
MHGRLGWRKRLSFWIRLPVNGAPRLSQAVVMGIYSLTGSKPSRVLGLDALNAYLEPRPSTIGNLSAEGNGRFNQIARRLMQKHV